MWHVINAIFGAAPHPIAQPAASAMAKNNRTPRNRTRSIPHSQGTRRPATVTTSIYDAAGLGASAPSAALHMRSAYAGSSKKRGCEDVADIIAASPSPKKQKIAVLNTPSTLSSQAAKAVATTASEYASADTDAKAQDGSHLLPWLSHDAALQPSSMQAQAQHPPLDPPYSKQTAPTPSAQPACAGEQQPMLDSHPLNDLPTEKPQVAVAPSRKSSRGIKAFEKAVKSIKMKHTTPKKNRQPAKVLRGRTAEEHEAEIARLKAAIGTQRLEIAEQWAGLDKEGFQMEEAIDYLEEKRRQEELIRDFLQQRNLLQVYRCMEDTDNSDDEYMRSTGQNYDNQVSTQ